MSESSLPRSVLVTGSGRRLGREIALGLAAAGWQVAIHYRASAAEAQDTAQDCRRAAPGLLFDTFDADLADENAVRELLPRAIARFGRIDAVVNNASLFEYDNAESFGYEALLRHMRTNAGAPVLLARALHEHVLSRGGAGAVVNLLDQKLWNQNPDFLSYTLSKAALEAANTTLALALAPAVRVVGVAPGLTLTSHMLSQERFEELHRLAPLGRASTPQDIAAAVRFALENTALTGTTIVVDGGQHLMKFNRDFSVM